MAELRRRNITMADDMWKRCEKIAPHLYPDLSISVSDVIRRAVALQLAVWEQQLEDGEPLHVIPALSQPAAPPAEKPMPVRAPSPYRAGFYNPDRAPTIKPLAPPMQVTQWFDETTSQWVNLSEYDPPHADVPYR